MTSLSMVRPRRLLDWREEYGTCVLLRPRLGTSRFGRKIARFLGDPYYRIRLDDVGTLVWKECDGHTSLADIAMRMRQCFGDRVEPVDERLGQFIRKMLKGRMLTVDDDQQGSGGRPTPVGDGVNAYE